MYLMINSLMISSLMNNTYSVIFFCIKYIGDSMKNLIDIRNKYEYKIGHIPNSINIVKDLLEIEPGRYIDKNEKYILYCERGIVSSELSKKLNLQGYNTESLKGGYSEYLKSNNNI